MKTYILVNLGLVAGAAFLILLYVVTYKAIIKNKCATHFTPPRVISAILAVALLITIIGNLLYINKTERKLDYYYYPNKVYIRSVYENDVTSYASIYSQYAEANSIPGYNRSVRQYNDVKYTYYLSNYPEEHIHPSFVIFAEYVGKENPESFEWGMIRFEWIKEGKQEAYVWSSGSYYSKVLMLIGDYDLAIDHLSLRTDYMIRGDNTWYDDETIVIPLNVRHYEPLVSMDKQ